MPSAEDAVEARVAAYDGAEFIITRRRWLHILDRHTELGTMLEAVVDTAAAPDEVFLDPRGSLHLIKRVQNAPADFLVLIARKKASKTYLITAYLVGLKRKERRYQKFRKLPLS